MWKTNKSVLAYTSHYYIDYNMIFILCQALTQKNKQKYTHIHLCKTGHFAQEKRR